MKTYVNLWQYFAEFFLELEMFQTKVVRNMKTHILCSVIFFFGNRAVYEIMWRNMVRAKGATDGNKIRRMRFACWINKVTHTHTHHRNM